MPKKDCHMPAAGRRCGGTAFRKDGRWRTVIAEIKKQRLTPPVCIGEVIAGNVLGTDVDVVATKTIEEQND